MSTLQFQVSSISELRAGITRDGVGYMVLGAYLTRDQMKGFISVILEKVSAQEFSAWMDELFPEPAKTNVNEELLEALQAAVDEVDGTFPFAFLEAAQAAIAKATGAQ